MYTISTDRIKETLTYKELIRKKDLIKARTLEKLDTRKIITNSFEIWKNTGEIPKHHRPGTLYNVIRDLIDDHLMQTQTDRSHEMTVEIIQLTNNKIIE